MKLTFEFTGDNKTFDLKSALEINIETDAEALGYITSVLFETALTLSGLMQSANPKYHARISKGVQHSVAEKLIEKNPHYPFTAMHVVDEPPITE